jgi:RNA polymerase sigma factor (sigma-70 family)
MSKPFTLEPAHQNEGRSRSGRTPLAQVLADAKSAHPRVANSAWKFLVESYSPALIVHAVRLVGNKDEAEDLVQLTFIRLFRNRATLNPDRNFDALVFTILGRLCYNHLRDRRVRLRVMTSGETGEQVHVAATRNTVASINSKLDLETLLELLEEHERHILMLREDEGLSFDEIALVIGTSVGAAKKRFARAHARARMIGRTAGGTVG